MGITLALSLTLTLSQPLLATLSIRTSGPVPNANATLDTKATSYGIGIHTVAGSYEYYVYNKLTTRDVGHGVEGVWRVVRCWD